MTDQELSERLRLRNAIRTHLNRMELAEHHGRDDVMLDASESIAALAEQLHKHACDHGVA